MQVPSNNSLKLGRTSITIKYRKVVARLSSDWPRVVNFWLPCSLQVRDFEYVYLKCGARSNCIIDHGKKVSHVAWSKHVDPTTCVSRCFLVPLSSKTTCLERAPPFQLKFFESRALNGHGTLKMSARRVKSKHCCLVWLIHWLGVVLFAVVSKTTV